jgi:2-polyprenyl-6-methoxyphenol hydroxylase-like FAD-dependent oxidoreductase
MITTPILIAGGGPVGLVLALELDHRGIPFLLVERNPTTTRHPKMDVTNGRSMEHFRRLGLADEIRAHAVPVDHPMDVVWVSRHAEWELARFPYASVEERRRAIRARNDGTQPLEPNMRISQIVLEPVLRSILEKRGRGASLRFGWGLESFAQDADGVTAVIRHGESGACEEVRSRYLAGCDGATSVTRKTLGIELDVVSTREMLGAMLRRSGIVAMVAGMGRALLRGERPADGRLYMIHFHSNDTEFLQRFGVVWHVQSPVAGTMIAQNDRDAWTIHLPLRVGMKPEELDPRQALFAALGREIECEIKVANAWTPRLAVAKSYGHGRVWLAGDSAHQFIPTGGYGMNTGVGDAVDLGWKLWALLQGWGGPRLLPGYDAERRPIGHRNRGASARHVEIRMQIAQAYDPQIHRDTPRGARARAALGRRILALGNLENEALGIEIGYRYDDSPLICREDGAAPAYEIERYVPSTWPGVRAPSVFLADGRALFDQLGQGFTLLRFRDLDAARFVDAAGARGVPLALVDVRDDVARTLYERDLVLLRPDQHVCWRGDEMPDDPRQVIDRVCGA